MFQINSLLLNNIGWVQVYSSYRPNLLKLLYTVDDRVLIRLYIEIENKKFALIKELSEEEKQISNNSYKFILGKKTIEFKSNVELMKIIIKNEAFKEEYKRHFKLIKILK